MLTLPAVDAAMECAASQAPAGKQKQSSKRSQKKEVLLEHIQVGPGAASFPRLPSCTPPSAAARPPPARRLPGAHQCTFAWLCAGGAGAAHGGGAGAGGRRNDPPLRARRLDRARRGHQARERPAREEGCSGPVLHQGRQPGQSGGFPGASPPQLPLCTPSRKRQSSCLHPGPALRAEREAHPRHAGLVGQGAPAAHGLPCLPGRPQVALHGAGGLPLAGGRRARGRAGRRQPVNGCSRSGGSPCCPAPPPPWRAALDVALPHSASASPVPYPYPAPPPPCSVRSTWWGTTWRSGR